MKPGLSETKKKFEAWIKHFRLIFEQCHLFDSTASHHSLHFFIHLLFDFSELVAVCRESAVALFEWISEISRKIKNFWGKVIFKVKTLFFNVNEPEGLQWKQLAIFSTKLKFSKFSGEKNQNSFFATTHCNHFSWKILFKLKSWALAMSKGPLEVMALSKAMEVWFWQLWRLSWKCVRFFIFDFLFDSIIFYFRQN